MVYLMNLSIYCLCCPFRIVLFNLQSLDRVYNKWFGGDIITFYAFPKQSETFSESLQPSAPHCFFFPSSAVSQSCSVSLVFLSTQTQAEHEAIKWFLQEILLYHCKHLLSLLHSRLIMWMPNKSLQFPFPEFFKDLVFDVLYIRIYIYKYIYIYDIWYY